MSGYRLTLVTPQAVVFDGEVVSLVAPGGAGSFGVLTHHAPLISTLTPGMFTVTPPNEGARYFEVGAGFLDVYKNEVTVVAEFAREV